MINHLRSDNLFFITAWSNISKHILNSVMAIFEITLTNVGPLLWINMPASVVVLESYVGIAYITYHTQGFYSALASFSFFYIQNLLFF